MKVGITINSLSYTPEAFAYQTYLTAKGWDVQLAQEEELNLDNDINIYFMGTRPFWKKKVGSAKEIHEYQSLSVPKYSKFKDALKKIINKKPDGRIFLNSNVEDRLGFQDKVPSIQRDMGIDKSLFQTPNVNPQYDIVYAGSILGRAGLVENILMLAENGFSILLIGNVPNKYFESLKHHRISLTGKVSRSELPNLFKICRAGLNYTPDLYPFNIQTSTKTLEYLASGLHVISNRYQWIENFCNLNSYTPIWLNDSLSPEDLIIQTQNSLIPNLEHYSWNNILKKCSFDKFLINTLNK